MVLHHLFSFVAFGAPLRDRSSYCQTAVGYPPTAVGYSPTAVGYRRLRCRKMWGRGGGDTMRSRARGAHAHGNAARQAINGLWTEVCGQQKQSNDPGNNQHNPSTPTTGRR